MSIVEPDRAELVELNRTQLRLWGWGDPAAPPVLLLHGAYDHGRMFDELAPRVAALGFHAVAVDLRGHGDSGPVDSGMTWALHHIDLALLVDHLDAGPVGFIGHSFGAGPALGLAGAFPERVRWVVVLDGLGPPAGGIAPPDDLPGSVRQSFDRVDRVLLGDGPREWASLEEMAARRNQNNPRLSPEWALHLARHGARRGPGGGWVWKADPLFGLGVPSHFDVAMLEAEQRAVRRPVLVLSGSEPDTWRDLTPEEEAERVAWLGARHAVIEGTGHYLHLEAPDATMREIQAFLGEVGP